MIYIFLNKIKPLHFFGKYEFIFLKLIKTNLKSNIDAE